MVLSYTEDLLQIYFRYSPFHEMMGSLHVLTKPEHHPFRISWADKMISQLSEEAINTLTEIGNISDSFIAFVGILGNDESTWDLSISETIAYMKNMPLEDFFIEVINGHMKKDDITEALMLRKSAMKCPEKYQGIFKEKEKFRNKCISFFKDYYYNYYANDLSFAEPLLIRHLKKSIELCKNMGLYNYLITLHPRIEVTEDKINLHKYKVFEIQKNRLKKIVIDVDSYFAPHLLMGIEVDEGYLNLITPTHITACDNNYLPQDTLLIYKSIADETRLKIIKLLYRGAKSTQHLAHELELTEACISKHLKILSQAGLTSKTREKNFILYNLNQQVLNSLVLYMYELIQ